MKKIKRYKNDGMVESDYDSSDDAKNLIAASERETAEATKPAKAADSAPAASAEPLKMASFGEAFKEARSRGDKTFEYMGKKYTTELASEKKSAAAESPKTAMQKRAAKQTAARESTAKSPSLIERFKSAMANPDNPRLRRERAEMGMKKGGVVKSSASKRADGCAQRGRTRGKVM